MTHSRAGIGWSYLAGGSEYYRACLKWHTSLDITPEEVHTKGLAEVKRISGLMKTVRFLRRDHNHKTPDKERFISIMQFSSPNPRFDFLLEIVSSRRF